MNIGKKICGIIVAKTSVPVLYLKTIGTGLIVGCQARIHHWSVEEAAKVYNERCDNIWNRKQEQIESFLEES